MLTVGSQAALAATTSKISIDEIHAGAIDGASFCPPYLEDKIPRTTVLDLLVFALSTPTCFAQIFVAPAPFQALTLGELKCAGFSSVL